jgi:hypothetical protein
MFLFASAIWGTFVYATPWFVWFPVFCFIQYKIWKYLFVSFLRLLASPFVTAAFPYLQQRKWNQYKNKYLAA